MLTLVHTRTHNTINFADPYKQCLQCGGWITGVLDKPGPSVVVPCVHESDYRDVCSSWSPVVGCRCAKFGWSHGRPECPAFEGQPF